MALSMDELNVVFEITTDGDLLGLYTDKINLFEIGRLKNIKKASDVEFNEQKQKWEVLSHDGKVVHENKNRESAIDWEIKNFNPTGPYYNT